MKIIQLIQKPQRRGAEIFAVQLAEELQRIGHQLKVISIFKVIDEIQFTGEIQNLNRPLSKRFFDYKGWKGLASEIKAFQPDIIQANAADTLKFAVFSRMLFQWTCPIVYRNANQMGDFIRGRLHKNFNQFLLNRVQGIVSVSQASQDDLQKIFSITDCHQKVIPIGIYPDEINSQISEISEQPLPENFILQIGGLVPEKDPIISLDILKSVSDSDQELALIFLGSGRLEGEIKEKISDFKFEDKVFLIPNQSNIFPILKKAKALIMPSKIEGLPGVILEAMYCQIPVVAYGVGGIPEVLVNGQTGWCIAPNDQEGFISAVEQVLNMDTESKEQLLSNAYQLVTTQYTLEKVALQFEDFYSKLLLDTSDFPSSHRSQSSRL